MFTGIIEALGIITDIKVNGSNKTYWVKSAISSELVVDQSVSHNGVCLTVEEIKDNIYQVTAISETLLKSNLGDCKIGDSFNLERCMQMNGRIDGHIVQGHVDATATVLNKTALAGSWEYEFGFPAEFSNLIIEKGSVCVNGISLTAFNVKKNAFSVAIIPYTYEHTNLRNVEAGMRINIEFDMIGKYLHRFYVLQHS